MATPSKVLLDVDQKPVFYLPGMNKDTATKASELLQKNHKEHHIFFNSEGFHNHIAHHLLTLYALGANAQDLQRHYDNNASYQRPPLPVHDRDVEAMKDPAKFKQYLGNEKYYHDYLVFFQQEIEAKGWPDVINEYLFAGDDRANDMLVRTFSGFLHPTIHLGFGIEFRQPAIIAEALAQAAVHSNWMRSLFLSAEEAVRSNPPARGGKKLVALLREIHNDSELSNAPHWSDGNKIRDGILPRAGERMLSYVTQYVVRPEDDLDLKTAEMINAVVLYTGGAQRPPKQVKFDFYFMHCVNCSIFYSSFLKQDWLSDSSKRRLLEWKGRSDLAMYASRRSPDMLIQEIETYRPLKPGSDVCERVLTIQDDGHAAKLLRALENGKNACAPFESSEGFEVKGEMWDKLLHMAIDSVEGTEQRWVRSAGFDEAWENIRDRVQASL